MFNMNNLIYFNNFKTSFRAQTNYAQNSFQNLRGGASLRPLAKDTVSFKGGKYDGDIDKLKETITDPVINASLHEKAKPANKYLNKILTKHFTEIIYSEDGNKDGVIFPLKIRVKSPDSIGEKVTNKTWSRFTKTDKDIKTSSGTEAGETIILPRSEVSIKKNIKDISGGRIVVRDTDDSVMDAVIDKLCKMIREESLIIDEIENHISPSTNAKPYFTDRQLQTIKEAVNEVRVLNGYKEIEPKINENPSGYMALHLSIDTTMVGGQNRNYNGFWSELQILGSDVEKLKDIEDLCYKLKQKMAIKEKDGAYEFFRNVFYDAYFDSKGEVIPEIEKAFDEYTIRAYEMQRNRRPTNSIADNINSWDYKYPSLKDCGLEGRLPAILDFNILARIKRSCDDLYNIRYNTQEILDKMDEKKIGGLNLQA